MPLYGAHMSVAGGLYNSFDQMEMVGGHSLAIFTKNQRQWSPKPLTDEVADKFIKRWEECGKVPVSSHGSYLLNLATPDPELERKTIENLTDELMRCQRLKIPYVVVHPGAHLGTGVEAGIERIANRLDQVLETPGTENVMILLETTSKTGTTIGGTFEELGAMLAQAKRKDRLGVCLDTCHIHAAGYDITSPESYEKVFSDFHQKVGIKNLLWFHLNDSLGALGAKKDRHTHIGEGAIGLEAFRSLVNDPRFKNHPMTLETPKEDDLAEDIRNLSTLRQLQKTL